MDAGQIDADRRRERALRRTYYKDLYRIRPGMLR